VSSLSLSPGGGGARERAAPCRGRQDRLEHAPARLALRVRDWRAQCKALVLVCVATLAGAAVAATPPNTAITNTATASYAVTGTPTTVSGSVTVTTVARTPSTIELM
jgi:hypothetical protein